MVYLCKFLFQGLVAREGYFAGEHGAEEGTAGRQAGPILPTIQVLPERIPEAFPRAPAATASRLPADPGDEYSQEGTQG